MKIQQALQLSSRMVYVVAAVLGVLLTYSLMYAPKASAVTVGTCHAWQITAHTRSRDCDTNATRTLALQYSDYGSADGGCIKPSFYNSAAFVWDTFDDETWPLDCGNSPSGYTTVFHSWGGTKGWGEGNMRVVIVGGTNSGQYSTTCLSFPYNPGFVSGKPICFKMN